MRWLPYAVACALFLASADFFVKLASNRISSSVGAMVYGAAAFLTGLTWVIVERMRGEAWTVTPIGVGYSILVGIAFSAVTILLYVTYTRANVSLASPVIRLSAILMVSVAGLLLLREPFTWRYGLGLVAAIGGIILMISR